MDRLPVLAPARSSKSEPAVRPASRGASRMPGRGRLTFWLVILGVGTLAASVALASLSLNPRTAGSGTSTSRRNTDRRAVAVAYVDVEGGVRSLYPAQPGRVIATEVAEGQLVEKDTVLLRVDDSLAQVRLKEAELDLEAAQEKLAQAKDLPAKKEKQLAMHQAALVASQKQHAVAVARYKKVQRLFNLRAAGSSEDVIAAEQAVEAAEQAVKADEAKLALAKLVDPQAAIRFAEVEVRAKEEQVKKAQLAVRECQIRAPCKGKVIRWLVHVGEILGPNPTRPALEFCPEGDLIVRAEVEQEFAGKLTPNMKVTITDDVTNKGEWKGQVTRISEWFTQRRSVIMEPLQYNDVRTLEVIIKVTPDPNTPLRINQRVRVRLDG